jgi:hypothetical protein
VAIRGLRALARGDDQHANSVEMQILKVARGEGVTRHGDWEEVIRLLGYHRINPSTIVCPNTKYSLLALAATEPAPEACERLMAMGVDRSHGGTLSRTPLMNAIYARDSKWGSRNRKVVELLASTIDEQDSDGRTALMFASVGAGVFSSRRGNLNLVKQLVGLGADLSIRNRWGRTALMEAIKENDASPTSANADVVELLMTYTIEREARRLFEENYQAVFSDSGELTLRPKSVPAEPIATQAPPPAKGWTRTRAAREDATVQAITRKVEKFFGLPEDSVALIDKKRKPLQGMDTIGSLWRRHSK